jgi:hypothetical protein
VALVLVGAVRQHAHGGGDGDGDGDGDTKVDQGMENVNCALH